MQEVQIIEKTNYKELEKSINDTLKYLEENDDTFIELINIAYSAAVIKDEKGDDVVYYSAIIMCEYDDEPYDTFEEPEQEK